MGRHTPSTSGPCTPVPSPECSLLLSRSQPGSSTAAASSQKHSVKQSMISDTAFREPLWQQLHTASLKLARQAVRMAQRQHTSRAGAAAEELPATLKPDRNTCIDTMADSRGAYSRGAEELGQVGLSIWCDASDMGVLLRGNMLKGFQAVSFILRKATMPVLGLLA